MAEKLETPKLNLKESIVSSSVFSGASTAKITPKISFGGLSKVIGTQPSLLDAPKLDVPKSNPLADIVAQLQVKFESLSSRVRANVRDIGGLKKTVETEKGLSSAKEDTLIETNRILVEIQNQLALDFANRITEKKEKLDLIKESILKKRVADEEADLEKVDKKAKDTKKKTDKVIKPVQGIFDKILEFFALLGGGLIASTGFEWLTDPANADKIAGVFKWLTENWNWIVGATAIAGAIVTIGTLGLALVGIWKILAGIGTVISAIAPFAIPIAVIMLSGFGFNWLLDRIIDYYNDPEHPERNFVGDLVPGAPPDALPGDWFVDANGQIWVKQNFDSSNGGWSKASEPPDPNKQQRLVDLGIEGARVGRELEAVPIDEFDTGGRVLPYEFFIRNDSTDSNQNLFEALSSMNPSINIANSFGGPLIGPSHEDGGIPIIVEGGEYIVRKSEVNPWSERFLNDFNNNGSLLWTRFDEINELMGDNHSEYQKLISGFSESISSLNSDFSYISPFTIPVEEEDDRNWLQKFWDWFVPPAHLSAEPSVRAGIRTRSTGFSHVESMSGGSQLFGAPTTEEDSSFVSPLGIEYDIPLNSFEFNAFRKDGPRINFSEFTFQGSEILVPSDNTGTQNIESPSGSTGRIDIDPFDVTNVWRNKTFDIYGIGGELNDATS